MAMQGVEGIILFSYAYGIHNGTNFESVHESVHLTTHKLHLF